MEPVAARRPGDGVEDAVEHERADPLGNGLAYVVPSCVPWE